MEDVFGEWIVEVSGDRERTRGQAEWSGILLSLSDWSNLGDGLVSTREENRFPALDTPKQVKGVALKFLQGHGAHAGIVPSLAGQGPRDMTVAPCNK
jgi:hypothetical protein